MANKNKLELQMYEWEEDMLKEFVEQTKLNETVVLNMLSTFLLSEVTAMMEGNASMLGSMTAAMMKKRVDSDEKGVTEMVEKIIDSVAVEKDKKEE